ncbi:MAG TPA: DUF5676 family membrane protein [Candidatus Nanoarchaeia archaeon]|nr:DUF5676 family membrane protein [Candidatus Nanoarchaeia archaeon]
MAKQLNELALGYAGAVVGAGCVLILSIISPWGMYAGAMQLMRQRHMFWSSGFGGTLGGIVEAAVLSFIAGYALAWLYNRFSR